MENKYQRKQIVPKSTKADKMFYLRPPSPTQAEKDADRLEELKEQFKINKCVSNVDGGSSSKINPIDRTTISRLLCIDTTFRHNYATTKSSDFIYTCPENIKKVTSLKISAIEIPNNWYAFSDALMNNIFTVTDNITKVVYVFKIPEGNYTSDDISSITLIQVSPITPGIPDKAITVDIITSKTTIFLRNTGEGKVCTNCWTDDDISDPPQSYVDWCVLVVNSINLGGYSYPLKDYLDVAKERFQKIIEDYKISYL
jgi:hypothetical protein